MYAQRGEWGRWQEKVITPELVQELASNVRSGLDFKNAAKRAGVPPGMLIRWLKAGAEEIDEIHERGVGHPGPCGMLFEEVGLRASGDMAAALVERIREGENDWKPSAWLLERLERDSYGRRDTGERGPVTIIVNSAFPGIGPSDVIEVEAAEVRELETGDV